VTSSSTEAVLCLVVGLTGCQGAVVGDLPRPLAGAPNHVVGEAGSGGLGQSGTGKGSAGVSSQGGSTGGASAGAGTDTGGVSSSEGWLEIYPAPAGVAASALYEVTLIQGEVRSPSFVYQTAPKLERGHDDTDGGDEFRDGWRHDGAPYRSFSWSTFAFSGKVIVEVRLKAGSIKTARVRPSRHGIAVERVDDSTVRFTLSEPGAKLSVELNDTVDDALLIFADVAEPEVTRVARTDPDTFAPEPGPVEVPESSKAVYFGPGLYQLGRWHVPKSVERVYLAGGAFVLGSLDVDDRERFELTGRGVLSGHDFVFRAHRDSLQHVAGASEKNCWTECLKLVELWSVKNALIDGVTLLESPYYFIYPRGSTRLDMRRFKILGSWTWNTDGPELTEGGTVEDCFVQTNDDMFKLYHSGARVRRCVGWHMHNGGMFQMGWTTKSFSDVEVSDIDLIHGEWRWTQNLNNGVINHAVDPSGVFRPSGNGTISNVVFRDINVEGTLLRAVGLYAFEGMTLRNFRITNLAIEAFGGDISPAMAVRNDVQGLEGGRIEDLTFEHLTVGDELVTSDNAASTGKLVIDAGSTSGIQFTP
jgi:hypothetical protein